MREGNAPGHCPAIRSFRLDYPLEDGVTSVHDQRAAFNQSLERLEHPDDDQNFLFCDVIPEFRIVKDPPRESHRLNDTIISLLKNRTSGPLVGMWDDDERFRAVWVLEHWRGHNLLLQDGECFLRPE
ncbi:hypothetical protein PR003_g29631 [Phytophthora rubi]|uniref:Uncharacterized protein n=1 Tax=Phytophthora rubi TaxID=129364 RepID=A0A6A3HA01_9STRA|nr:hypothetical protein PR001_g28547 [Phytophthora rubi]KAE9274368.1 hypothetical protein PR003_g29631 [Phytophthora rubi]